MTMDLLGSSDDMVDVDLDDFMQRPTLAKGEAAHNMTPLPDDFQPSDNDVICGRGRRCFNHPGNKKFRDLVADNLEHYSNAVSKLEKTYILSDIVSQVRANSPDGGFVKKDPDTGKWFEVGDFLAREKTSQAFRDALHDQYKSSNTAKKKRRQAEQALKLHRAHSSSSLKADGSSSSEGQPEYTVNNSKFMRVDRLEDAQDFLLGELDREIEAQFSPSDGRKFFASQKSARSVLDLGSAIRASKKSAPWYNRSCPNLGQVRLNQSPISDDPPSKQNFDWFSTSTPNLLLSKIGAPPLAGGSSNPLLARALAARNGKREFLSKPTRPLQTFQEVNDLPDFEPLSELQESDADDFILSPIGDGDTKSLLMSLERLSEECTVAGDPFEPVPIRE